MDIVGVGAFLIFYAIILAFGIFIARRKNANTSEDFILAGKNIGFVVGIFTLVATEVGGAFVNGTAEEVYKTGFLWALAPIGYSLSMTINGLFFVARVRQENCITLIDILQKAYGTTIGGLIYLPSCVGDICWTAAVLSSLGFSLEVMVGVPRTITVVVSALVAMLYTILGGMSSVAYTDVVQLAFTIFGLWMVIPFLLGSNNVQVETASLADWTGSVTRASLWSYIDTALLILLGGIPWQPYYQRALALKNNHQVKILSISATLLSLSCMIPPTVIGVAAKTLANHNQTDVDPAVVLPHLIQEECPRFVALLCLAAISAAVMSSVDSAILAGASYVAHNVYGQIVVSHGMENKSTLPLKLSICLLGTISILLSLSTSTVYGLWVLAGDLGYVIVFPQFFAAIFLRNHVNSWGSILAACFGIVARIAIGEPLIGLPSLIEVGLASGSLMFPVKTMIMAASLATLLISSKCATTIYKAFLQTSLEQFVI